MLEGGGDDSGKKDSIFGALQAFAEMVRKAFGKHCRSGQIDFQMSPAAGSLQIRNTRGKSTQTGTLH